jgi:hypothetical protein
MPDAVPACPFIDIGITQADLVIKFLTVPIPHTAVISPVLVCSMQA